MFEITAIPERQSKPVVLPACVAVAMLWAIALALPEKELLSLLGWFYITQIIFFILLYWWKNSGNVYQIFKPSFIIFVYIGVSASLGAMVYAGGHVIGVHTYFYLRYIGFSDSHYLFYLISGSFLVIFFAASLYHKNVRMVVAWRERRAPPRIVVMIYFSTVFAAALFLNLLFPEDGLVSFAAGIARAISALGIFWIAFASRMRIRWPIVLFVVGAMSIIAYHDKRDAIFLLLPALFLEFSLKGRVAISPRLLLSLSALAAFVLYAIAAMSIARGYGGYDTDGTLSSLKYVPDYILNSGEAIAMIANNLELSYMFYVLHEAVYSSTVSGAAPLMLGESYLKAFFVGVPEWVLGYKPTSILDSYTNFLDPEFRAGGGSYPPTAIGEAFWNFGVFAFPIIFLICAILDRLYRFLVNTIRRGALLSSIVGLTIFHYILIFIRGSGVDLFLAYVIMSVIFGLMIIGPIAAFFQLAPARCKVGVGLRVPAIEDRS